MVLNPLPNNKFFDWSELKELADDKINVTEKLKFVLGRAENIVAENIVFKRLLLQGRYKQFLLFSQWFTQLYNFSASECGTVW